MAARVIVVDPGAPDHAALVDAAGIVLAGGLVAFPTETVYGLGATALDASAVARIFAAKGRPAANPIIVHVADVAAARDVAEWSAGADTLARAFWPGPLTLVLPRTPAVPDAVTAGGPTVAVRCPSHPVALGLLAAAGVPIAAPSANRSSRISATRADHVLAELADCIDLVLDGGPTPGGVESTVIDLSSGAPRVLRPGPVTLTAIASVLGCSVGLGRGDDELAVRSPGVLGRHYAPLAPVRLARGEGGLVCESEERAGRRVGHLALRDAAGNHLRERVTVRMPPDAAGYGAVLYTALRGLEDAGVDVIVVDLPPTGEEWMAVHDRLSRAAADA